MKKLFLSLVAAIVAATATYAQNTLVASLSHGDEVKMFYGTSALIDAVNESESGDVVTLSGGTFTCANFNKGITVRGAGTNAENPTVIGYTDYDNWNNTISIPTNDSRFTMEGVIVKLYYIRNGDKLNITGDASNIYFVKCKFETGLSFGSSSSAQATFVDCDVNVCSLDGSCTAKFSNCSIKDFTNSPETTSKAEFYNCLITGNTYDTKLYKSSFVNSILISGTDRYNGYGIPSETTVVNSLAIGSSFAFNGVISVVDCVAVDNSELPTIFKTYSSSTDRWSNIWYTPTEPYELTDEAKAAYVGTDGKEMGLYGGQYPYDFTPLYPQITKMNVAKQATADNKLSVEIEVSAVE